MNVEDQMFEFMLRQNISCISLFHNHVDVALKDRSKEIDSDEDLELNKNSFWKRQFDVIFQ